MAVPQVTTRFLTDGSVTLAKIATAAKASVATASTLIERDAAGRAQVVDPSAPADIATKAYVDAVLQGLDVKLSVRAATDAALPAYTRVGNVITADANGALPTIDTTVTLVDTNRILLKNGAAAADNGIYVVTAVGDGSNPFVLTRASDADNSPSGEVTSGMFTFVEEGTLYAGTGWVLTTAGAITINVTGLTFTQFSGGGTITASGVLTKTGNNITHNTSALAAGTRALGNYTTDTYGHVTGFAALTFQQGTGTAAGGETTISTSVANCVPNSQTLVINGLTMHEGQHYTFNDATGQFTGLDALVAADVYFWRVLAP